MFSWLNLCNIRSGFCLNLILLLLLLYKSRNYSCFCILSWVLRTQVFQDLCSLVDSIIKPSNFNHFFIMYIFFISPCCEMLCGNFMRESAQNWKSCQWTFVIQSCPSNIYHLFTLCIIGTEYIGLCIYERLYGYDNVVKVQSSQKITSICS